jgi:hypothetical protein
MFLTVLKIVAGLAVVGVIALVLIAVVSGLAGSVRALRKREGNDDHPGIS